MGVAFSFLDFFDLCDSQQALQGPMIALGSLEVNEPETAIQAFADKNPNWNSDRQRSVRSLFECRYGITEYRDCDFNDKSDISTDLNLPLKKELFGSAMTVLNGGTAEHVFNVAQVITSIHDMARAGATIIHLAPISWYDHGYYNFNPRFFAAVARENRYVLLAEAFWFASDMSILASQKFNLPRSRIGRFAGELLKRAKVLRGAPRDVRYEGSDTPLRQETAYITFNGQGYTTQHDLIYRLFSENIIPANALYMVAYRKINDNTFSFPYDIQG